MLGILNCSTSQINIPAILIANGLGSCLMLLILLSKHKRIWAGTRDGKIFYWMCRFCLILCLLETWGFFLDGKLFPGARQIALVCNTIIMLLAVLLSYLWICYVDCKLFASHKLLQTVCPFTAIPTVLTALIVLVNLFVPIFFGISDANTYYRTPLFPLPWAVAYFNTACGAIQSYCYQRKADKYLFIPVLLFPLPIYLGSLIQLFNYGISLIWVSVALGLTFLYINLQSEEAYLDPLTKLYNRSYLLHYMGHIARQARKGQRVTGIMLDINNFKHINDTFGHTKGDEVLQTIGKLLLRAAGDSTVVRYGGDEFVILLLDAGPQQLRAIQDSILREVQRYNASLNHQISLSLSIGTAEFDQKDVFRFFQEMDMKMYTEKRAFYLRREISEASADKR